MQEEKFKLIKEILGSGYRTNDEYLFFCPFCKHHKRKFSVNIEKGFFKCWICDTRGRNLQRIVRRFGTFHQKQHWKELTQTVDLSLFDELFAGSIEEEVQEKVILPEGFVSLVNKNPPMSSLLARKYLKSRGITRGDIVKWRIGYCTKGEYSGRIVVPSFNLDGGLNYFVARSYGNDYPKYKNPPSSTDMVFNHLNIDWASDLVIVEGVFDAIVAGPNSVPLLGSTLRDDSRLFKEIVTNDTPVYIALDPDAEKKSMKLIEKLLTYDVELYKLDINPYSDVGEMTPEEFLKRKENASPMTFDSCLMRKTMMI